MFTLEIKLGNEAMQTGADIAELLRRLAGLVEDYGPSNVAAGNLRDVNGNSVGSWSLS